MGALLQAFYWDCPKEERREFDWWNRVREEVPRLAKAGFTSLWRSAILTRLLPGEPDDSMRWIWSGRLPGR